VQLVATVRHGYDEELIFAQQLGADAVVVRCQGTSLARDAASAVHRVQVSGLRLAGIELLRLPVEPGAWTDAVRQVATAAGPRVNLLLPEIPEAATWPRPIEALRGLAAAMAASGTRLVIGSSGLAVQDLVQLEQAGCESELVVGQSPFEHAPGLPEALACQVANEAVVSVRFEGAGRLLADPACQVAPCAVRLTAAGYQGAIRAGVPPDLGADHDWRPQGAAADLGYLRAVLQSLASSGPDSGQDRPR
jgi:hypothetical protein